MTETVIVVLVAAIAVILAIALVATLVRRSSRLRPLPAESRTRFAQSWDELESRFIEDPHGAVQEADRIAVMILTERGATIAGTDVPQELQRARQAASSDEGRQGTEGMRKAMLQYQHIVVDAVGIPKDSRGTSRTEVAS